MVSYSVYHGSWLVYMISYVLLILLSLILDRSDSAFMDCIIMFTSIFMVLSTTVLGPLIGLVASVTRVLAFRNFSMGHIMQLQNAKTWYTFIPPLMAAQMAVSLPFQSSLLARKLMIELLPSVVGFVFVNAILGVSMGCGYNHRPAKDILDILLSMPNADIADVVQYETIAGRSWFALIRALHGFFALLLIGVTLQAVMSFDKVQATTAWQKRWKSETLQTTQLYTVVGEGLLEVSRVICCPGILLYRRYLTSRERRGFS